MHSLARISAAFIVSFLLVEAASAQESRYRELNQFGSGNCVFSPEELPQGQDNAPGYRQIRDTFADGEDIRVRCFFSDTLRSFFNEGVAYNSMREDSRRFVRLIWMRPEEISGSTRDFLVDGFFNNVTSSSRNWDQQRLDIYRQDDCDFRARGIAETQSYDPHPNGCIHLGNFIRMRAAEYGFSVPRTSEFCVEVYFEKADEYNIIQRGSALTQEPNTYDRRLAMGCFNVEVNG